MHLAHTFDGDGTTDDGGGEVVAAVQNSRQINTAEETADSLVSSFAVAAMKRVAVSTDVTDLLGDFSLVRVAFGVRWGCRNGGDQGHENGCGVHFGVVERAGCKEN